MWLAPATKFQPFHKTGTEIVTRNRIWFALLSILFTSNGWLAARSADQPNFVWLISEDNSIHYLKLFDPHGAPTPRIAELAQHGLLFDHAFSNAPVCSVARTTLMTGCYAPRIGTQFHRKNMTVPMPAGLKMFPAYLRAAGYYTSNNRKKDYNATESPDVWDESSAKATWRNRRAGQAFFHMQSFGVSHESSLHFSRSEMQQKTTTDPDSVFIAPYHPDTPTFRYTYARYHDRIRGMDSQIGAVVDQLKEDGLLEDTFVFYFGDHGGVLPGSKGYAYERGLHVPLVVRIPDRWQHLVQDGSLNSRQSGFVSFVDFGPTLLTLAGLNVPQEMDGRPFLGSEVSVTEVAERDEAFGYADRFDEKYDLVRTLRKGKFEYVRSYQPFNFDGLQNNYRYKMLAYAQWRELYDAGKLNAVQRQFFEPRPAEMLFDVERDPHETQNLAADPAYRSVLLAMRQRLAARVKGLPDLSLFPESFLVSDAFANPTRFGQQHRSAISTLVDIADLSLLSFDAARPKIEAALNAPDRWQRYWGLIVCSSFGEQAVGFANTAKRIVQDDEENLVRLRAAEFLALTIQQRPQRAVLDALSRSTSAVEANLVMNTLVLLRDGKPGYKFDVPTDKLDFPKLGMPELERRILYLTDKWQ